MNQSTLDDLAKLLLRLTLGVLILLHGLFKVKNGIGAIEGMVVANGLPKVISYGVFLGEVLGPVLLILGWHARVGAILIAGNMLFAVGLAHMGMLGQLNNEGGWALELQGMFLASAIALALLGPGRYSVNQR